MTIVVIQRCMNLLLLDQASLYGSLLIAEGIQVVPSSSGNSWIARPIPVPITNDRSVGAVGSVAECRRGARA
jgi:hypothetical protein